MKGILRITICAALLILFLLLEKNLEDMARALRMIREKEKHFQLEEKFWINSNFKIMKSL